VNAVPFAIYAANKVLQTGLYEMFNSIIETGGDTDTNASLAGQIAGALIGKENFPPELIAKLETVENYSWVQGIIENTKNYIG
jgi:ADP-ribosylglycohydrolase